MGFADKTMDESKKSVNPDFDWGGGVKGEEVVLFFCSNIW